MPITSRGDSILCDLELAWPPGLWRPWPWWAWWSFLDNLLPRPDDDVELRGVEDREDPRGRSAAESWFEWPLALTFSTGIASLSLSEVSAVVDNRLDVVDWVTSCSVTSSVIGVGEELVSRDVECIPASRPYISLITGYHLAEILTRLRHLYFLKNVSYQLIVMLCLEAEHNSVLQVRAQYSESTIPYYRWVFASVFWRLAWPRYCSWCCNLDSYSLPSSTLRCLEASRPRMKKKRIDFISLIKFLNTVLYHL